MSKIALASVFGSRTTDPPGNLKNLNVAALALDWGERDQLAFLRVADLAALLTTAAGFLPAIGSSISF
jgi:hypothetical protein